MGSTVEKFQCFQSQIWVTKIKRRRLCGGARHPIGLSGMSDKNTGRIAPPRRASQALNYLLIESFVIDPPFSIFTLITWIWSLSA